MMDDIRIKTSTRTKELTKADAVADDTFGVVRVYGYSPDRVNLQVRTHGTITDYGQAERRMISSAYLTIDDARAVRDALDAWIKEKS